MVSDKLLKIRRPEYLYLLFSADKSLGGQVSEQSDYMIAVQVADKNLVNPTKANSKFPELYLCALTTVD
jgi:hypothetical protein